MEYVGPFDNYKDWIFLVQYTLNMHRYGLLTNYLQLKDKDQNKGETLYIDGRPKTTRNIVGLINSTQLGSTLKKPNCIFEGCEGNFVLYVTLNQ